MVSKKAFDKMVKEKSHSELLVDLITHNIGKYHSITQGRLDLMTDLIEEKLNYHGNIKRLNSSNFISNDFTESKTDISLNGHDPYIFENDFPISKLDPYDILKYILSYVTKIQIALDRSSDIVKNIIKLEKL